MLRRYELTDQEASDIQDSHMRLPLHGFWSWHLPGCARSRLYKERHLVEKYFLKLKGFRRIATRYDKLAFTYMGFVCLASILIWIIYGCMDFGTGSSPAVPDLVWRPPFFAPALCW